MFQYTRIYLIVIHISAPAPTPTTTRAQVQAQAPPSQSLEPVGTQQKYTGWTPHLMKLKHWEGSQNYKLEKNGQ